MSWFNYIGLIVVAAIMAPNVVYAAKCREGFSNAYKNKAAAVCEQVGRYGCIVFMIFNIPRTYFNFWFGGAYIAYAAINACLCAAYITCWIVLWKKPGILRAVLLSVLPSCVFLFSGAVLASIPLLICSALFAPSHILISCKNARGASDDSKGGDF